MLRHQIGGQDLWHAILDEWPGYLGYLVSFSTVGALWLGHNAITGYMDRVDQNFLRLNLAFLFFVCLLPFVTRLLSEFIDVPGAERVASIVYGMTLLVCATLVWALWRYALGAGLALACAPRSERGEVRRMATAAVRADRIGDMRHLNRPTVYDEISSRRTTAALHRPRMAPATVSEMWCWPR